MEGLHGFVRLYHTETGGTVQIGIRGLLPADYGNYQIGFYGIRGQQMMVKEWKKDVLFREEELRDFSYDADVDEKIQNGEFVGMVFAGAHDQLFFTEFDELEAYPELLQNLVWKNDWDEVLVESTTQEIQDSQQEEVSIQEVRTEIPDFLKVKKPERTPAMALDSDYRVRIVDWKDLFQKYDCVEPFAEREFFDCVEIGYDDLKYLPMQYKDLHNNSFLLHGLYRYHHLLLGKYKEKKKARCYLLGVPGLYDRSEKILAPTFGFDNFKLARHQNIRCMNFGYWYTFFNGN